MHFQPSLAFFAPTMSILNYSYKIATLHPPPKKIIDLKRQDLKVSCGFSFAAPSLHNKVASMTMSALVSLIKKAKSWLWISLACLMFVFHF